jgi:endonuclease-3
VAVIPDRGGGRSEPLEPGRSRAREVDRRLSRAFGVSLPPPAERRDIVHELIHAVLSQNTSRRNYNLAYSRLMEAFPTVDDLACARVTSIESAIRPGGLSKQKSKTIKEILGAVKAERGDHSLEFIRDISVPEAREYLTALPGVGPKTASVVLMFADGRKVLPVDTHVLRTSKRIGLIDAGTDAIKAQERLEEIVPPRRRPEMHLELVTLGREICRARGPRHEICPVNMVCDLYQQGRHPPGLP